MLSRHSYLSIQIDKTDRWSYCGGMTDPKDRPDTPGTRDEHPLPKDPKETGQETDRHGVPLAD